MKNLICLSLIFSLFSLSANAQDSAIVKKGDPSPFDGIVFTEKKANDIRYQLIQLDTLQKINESYEKTVVLYKKNEDYKNDQLSVLLTRNDDLAKELKSSQQMSSWEKVAYFALGVIGTTAAVYAAGKVIK